MKLPASSSDPSSPTILAKVSWDLDAVRPGILVYGYGRGTTNRTVDCRPFLHWKTRVVQVKRVPQGFPVSYHSTHVTPRATLIGTLDVGYADGYRRESGNRGTVLVGGRRCAVIGEVTMNLTTVDLGADSPVKPGDEAVLLGQQGDDRMFGGADDDESAPARAPSLQPLEDEIDRLREELALEREGRVALGEEVAALRDQLEALAADDEAALPPVAAH